jgi:hypothetical protein
MRRQEAQMRKTQQRRLPVAIYGVGGVQQLLREKPRRPVR